MNKFPEYAFFIHSIAIKKKRNESRAIKLGMKRIAGLLGNVKIFFHVHNFPGMHQIVERIPSPKRRGRDSERGAFPAWWDSKRPQKFINNIPRHPEDLFTITSTESMGRYWEGKRQASQGFSRDHSGRAQTSFSSWLDVCLWLLSDRFLVEKRQIAESDKGIFMP